MGGVQWAGAVVCGQRGIWSSARLRIASSPPDPRRPASHKASAPTAPTRVRGRQAQQQQVAVGQGVVVAPPALRGSGAAGGVLPISSSDT